MCNILLISHSRELGKAVYDFVNEMKQKDFEMDFVGGTDHGKQFGSDPLEIVEKYKKLIANGKSVLVLYDLGSSFLNGQSALELLEKDEDKKQIEFAHAAFVEGSLIAVCSNNYEMTSKELKEIVEGQCKINK